MCKGLRAGRGGQQQCFILKWRVFTGVDNKNFFSYFGKKSGFTYYCDAKAKAPWQYNKQKKFFATFDNKKSIGEKTDFIQKHNLGGKMFWELSLDKSINGLVDAIKKGLLKELWLLAKIAR